MSEVKLLFRDAMSHIPSPGYIHLLFLRNRCEGFPRSGRRICQRQCHNVTFISSMGRVKVCRLERCCDLLAGHR
jgi:hypothetical protein